MAKILLNKENLFFNLEEISKKTGGKEKIAVVLKDNAYGHGIVEIAKMAKEFGIEKVVVRTIEEANKIKDIFDYIIVLSQKDIHSYSHSFHIALNSMEYIDKMPENSNVHIAIDAGMHRQGILPEELEEAFNGLLARNINITGVFTHHKGADALSCEYFCQKQVFNSLKQDVKKICEKLNVPVPSFHSCSSPALFRCENFEDDFARIGLATYGYLDDAEVYEFPKLKPVMSLWASRFSTRVLKEKQAVGYGGGYVADKDMVISTYDIGYGDGLFRLTEKDEYVTPKGYKILGRMSMDSLSLNSEDDEVCIFNDATDLAKLHNTIIYEILVSLKENIERVLE